MKVNIGLLLFCLVGAAISTHAEEKYTSPVMSVNVVKPRQEDWLRTVEATGFIQPWHMSLLSSRIGGVAVTDIYVEVGEHVKRNQVLAKLDSNALLFDRAKAKANLAKTKANLSLANANLKRSKRLKESQLVSEQGVEQLEIEQELINADLQSAIAQLQAIELAISYSEIVAIDNGIIAERNISVGEVVSVGQPTFSLIRQNKMEWVAEIEAQYAANISPGTTCTIDLGESKTVGQVKRLSPLVDSSSRLNSIFVSVDSAIKVHAGELVRGECIIGSAAVLTLPSSAVVWRDGESLLMVVGEQDQIFVLPVEIGKSRNDRVEILTDIDSNLKIVTSGGAFLNTGDMVSIVSGSSNIEAGLE